MLTRHRTTIHLRPGWDTVRGNHVYALVPDGALRTVSPVVALDESAWQAMGRPDCITVTIEPGDLLND